MGRPDRAHSFTVLSCAVLPPEILLSDCLSLFHTKSLFFPFFCALPSVDCWSVAFASSVPPSPKISWLCKNFLFIVRGCCAVVHLQIAVGCIPPAFLNPFFLPSYLSPLLIPPRNPLRRETRLFCPVLVVPPRFFPVVKKPPRPLEFRPPLLVRPLDLRGLLGLTRSRVFCAFPPHVGGQSLTGRPPLKICPLFPGPLCRPPRVTRGCFHQKWPGLFLAGCQGRFFFFSESFVCQPLCL